MRSPVAMSNGCAPVFASYSAITRFTSSISAVAGSYSIRVVSPWDENVRILAFMLDLLRDFFWLPRVRSRWVGVPRRHIALISKDVKTAFPRDSQATFRATRKCSGRFLQRFPSNMTASTDVARKLRFILGVGKRVLGRFLKHEMDMHAMATRSFLGSTQRAMGMEITFADSLRSRATPSRYETTLPELAARRSPGTMMPTRFSGSAAEIAMISLQGCRLRMARKDSTATGNANCSPKKL